VCQPWRIANVLSGITIDCTDPARLAAFWGALLDRPEAPSPARLAAVR
jgi:Glyoxalase-like domain